MKKISTLYKKDPKDLSRVIPEVDPQNEWVFEFGIPTRKYDGTSCAIINGELYKRYDVKRGKSVPEGAIPCQDPDSITGHWPHWVKCDPEKPEDKWHFEGLRSLMQTRVKYQFYSPKILDGTYELCGPKIGVNAEKCDFHVLIKHGIDVLNVHDFTFEGLKKYLSDPGNDIEGIVFHHKTDGRMCKIRKCDFGIKR